MLRALFWALAVLVPIFVAMSRLYRGMHHADRRPRQRRPGGRRACSAPSWSRASARPPRLPVRNTRARPRAERRGAGGVGMTSIAVLAHSAKTFDGGLPQLRRTLAGYGFADPPWVEVMKAKRSRSKRVDSATKGADLVFVWGGDGIGAALHRRARRHRRPGRDPARRHRQPVRDQPRYPARTSMKRSRDRPARRPPHARRRQRSTASTSRVMAGAGLRRADDPRRRRGPEGQGSGRLAYVWTGARRTSVATRCGRGSRSTATKWFDGKAQLRARRQRRRRDRRHRRRSPTRRPTTAVLDIGVVTAKGGRGLGRTPRASWSSDARRIAVRPDDHGAHRSTSGLKDAAAVRARRRRTARPRRLKIEVEARRDHDLRAREATP